MLFPCDHCRCHRCEQIIDRGCTVGERHDVVIDAGTANVALDQTGVSSSSSIMMMVTGLLMYLGSGYWLSKPR